MRNSTLFLLYLSFERIDTIIDIILDKLQDNFLFSFNFSDLYIRIYSIQTSMCYQNFCGAFSIIISLESSCGSTRLEIFVSMNSTNRINFIHMFSSNQNIGSHQRTLNILFYSIFELPFILKLETLHKFFSIEIILFSSGPLTCNNPNSPCSVPLIDIGLNFLTIGIFLFDNFPLNFVQFTHIFMIKMCFTYIARSILS